MEQEILDRLDEEYDYDIVFDVEWIDFRIYKIYIYLSENKYATFEYKYNVNFTFDYNMSIIIYMIDKKIKEFYKNKRSEEIC